MANALSMQQRKLLIAIIILTTVQICTNAELKKKKRTEKISTALKQLFIRFIKMNSNTCVIFILRHQTWIHVTLLKAIIPQH